MRINQARMDEIADLEDHCEKVYQAALYYIGQGIPVLPMPKGSRFVADNNIYNRFSCSKARVEEWFNPKTGKNRGWNIAIGCGDYYGKGGVFAVDVDVKFKPKYEGQDWGKGAWDKLIEEHGPVYGPVQQTPSGGLHILMTWQPNCTPSQDKIALGIDTRGGHEGKISSHIMAFPSIADDVQYTWIEGAEVVEPPVWIKEIMGVSWAGKKVVAGGGRGSEEMDAEDMEEIEPFERIREALFSFKAEDLSYIEWVKCGQAIHSQYPGDDGLELWVEWSKLDKREKSGYHPGDCETRWKKFGQGKGVRISSLYYITKQYGTLPAQPGKKKRDRQLVDGDVDDPQDDMDDVDDDVVIQDLIDEYNTQYAVVLSGEKAKIVRKEADLDTGQNVYSTYNVDAFKAFLSNDKIFIKDAKGNPKPVKKFDIWMSSPKRRTFDGIVMRPDQPPLVQIKDLQYLNTWAGFAIKPQEGDWTLLKEHIRIYLCRENEEHYEWLMDWMADMFQEPHNPKGCAVILGGKEGTGKGTVANAIAKIFGIHAVMISNSSHLTSQYNAMIMDSVFLFADEVVYGGNHDAANRLKAMVTEEKNTREKKFGDQKQVKQYLHIMMASNNHWKIAAGPDSRRWFVLEVDTAMASNEEYFKAIRQQLTDGGYAAMLHELLNREVTHNLRLAPVTEELKHQRALMSAQSTFESFPAWIAHVAVTGVLGPRDIDIDSPGEADEWPKMVSKQDLWEAYARWSKDYRPRAPVLAINIFAIRVGALGFDTGPRQGVKEGRARTYKVPPFKDFIDVAKTEYAVIADEEPEDETNAEPDPEM